MSEDIMEKSNDARRTVIISEPNVQTTIDPDGKKTIIIYAKEKEKDNPNEMIRTIIISDPQTKTIIDPDGKRTVIISGDVKEKEVSKDLIRTIIIESDKQTTIDPDGRRTVIIPSKEEEKIVPKEDKRTIIIESDKQTTIDPDGRRTVIIPGDNHLSTTEHPVINENREDVVEKIIIYFDPNNRPYISRYACERFLAVPEGDPIRIDGKLCYPVSYEDAQIIVDNQENSFSPYAVEARRFEFVKEEEEIAQRDFFKNDEIIIDDPVTLELGEFSEELIPGSDIHRPRRRGDYETDEEYVAFLRRFYAKYFPYAEYVQKTLQYCQENQINLYDHFKNVASSYQSATTEKLPDFESENPFLSEGDIKLLLTSNDEMIGTYFANTMMNTIGLNISDFQKDKLADLFTPEEENYNEEIVKQYH